MRSRTHSRPELAASVIALVLGLLGLQSHPVLAGSMSLDARSTNEGILIHFTYVEDPDHPTGHPEWVQYRVMAWSPSVPLPDCGPGTNGGTIAYYPRSGGTDDITFLFTPPPTVFGFNLYYEVFPANAAGERLLLDPSACRPCWGGDYAPYPLATAPVALGTLEDLGWALRLNQCEGGCGGSHLLREPWATQLRPLAGTGQAVLLYGEVSCNPDWEGGASCDIALDHWVPWTCPTAPVPTHRSSWGKIKTLYR